LKIIKKVTV